MNKKNKNETIRQTQSLFTDKAFAGTLPEGICYGRNAIGIQEKILLNRENLFEGNGLVFGQENSGKHFYIKGEIAQNLLNDRNRIVIVDENNELEPFVEQFGGRVYTVGGTDKDYHLNPFDMIIDWDSAVNPVNNKTKEIVGMFNGLMGEGRTVTAKEANDILSCCTEVYGSYLAAMIQRKKEGKEGVVDFGLCPTGDDFYAKLKEINADLATFLEPFVEYLSFKTDIPAEERFISLNLAEIPTELLPAFLYYGASFASAKKDETHTVWVYIESVWKIVSENEAVLQLWKKNKSVILTGIVDDAAKFLKNNIGQDIFYISGFITAFNLKPYDRKVLSQALNLNEKAISFLENNTAAGNGLLYIKNREAVMFRYEIKDSEIIQDLSLKNSASWLTHTMPVFDNTSVYSLKNSNLNEDGIFYGFNQKNGRQIIVDRNNLKNSNGLMFGVSGSGKTFALKNEIYQVHKDNPDASIIVIDPEGEFPVFAEYLGGTVIELNPQEGTYINPFDVLPGPSMDKKIVEMADNIVSLVEAVLGKSRECNSSEANCIHRCCRRMYEPYMEKVKSHLKDGNYDVSDISFCPTLLDFYNELIEDSSPEGMKIANAMERYCIGTDNYFAHHTNVDICRGEITVINMEKIPYTMKEFAMKAILPFVQNFAVRQNPEDTAPVWIYYNEMHMYFKTSFSASTFAKMWTDADMRHCVLTGITQDVSDLLTSNEGRQVFKNTGIFNVLGQSSLARAQLGAIWHLTEKQLEHIKDCPHGNSLLYNSINNRAVPIVLHVDEESKEILEKGFRYPF